MNRLQEGMADLEEASREKSTEEHNVIDDAIQDRGAGYTVFSIVSADIFLVCLISLTHLCPCSLLESFTDPLRRSLKTRLPVITWAKLWVLKHFAVMIVVD